VVELVGVFAVDVGEDECDEVINDGVWVAGGHGGMVLEGGMRSDDVMR
jgi:hypothetical protein